MQKEWRRFMKQQQQNSSDKLKAQVKEERSNSICSKSDKKRKTKKWKMNFLEAHTLIDFHLFIQQIFEHLLWNRC